MRQNNFDLLRLLAALGVFFAHGFYLYDKTGPAFFNNTHSLGSLSVYVFFFISGHLTLQSWRRNPHLSAFAAKRALRIFPGLIVASAISVFVIGTLVTRLEPVEFLSSPSTWGQFANYASALATRHELPGVFEQLPFAHAVNGSLWTIKYEIVMYCLLALIGVAGLLSRWWLSLLVTVCLYAALLPQPWSLTQGGPLDWKEFWPFAAIFFTGAAFNYLPSMPLRWMIAPMLAGLALTFVKAHPALTQLGVLIWLPCTVWLLAFFRPLTRLQPRHDLSYGIYIYAFPVQQAITELSLSNGLSKLSCLAISLTLTLLLALWSWFAIERPSIHKARSIGRSPAANSMAQ